MSNFVLSQTRSLGIRHGRAFMWRHSPFTTIVPAEWKVVKLHVGQRTLVMRAQCFISEWFLCFVTGTVYIRLLGLWTTRNADQITINMMVIIRDEQIYRKLVRETINLLKRNMSLELIDYVIPGTCYPLKHL